jgi:hypothetical protein
MENFCINPPHQLDNKSSKIPTDIELPVLTADNAILYKHFNDSYSYLYPVGLHSGLVLHNSQYYYFYHDITNAPTRYGRNLGDVCFSHNIYLLKDDYAKKLINTKTTNYWEIILHSFFYFGKTYLSIGVGNHIKNYIYESTIVENTLIIPYSKTPASLRSKSLVKDFLKQHQTDYPKSIDNIEINRALYREMILSTLV